MSIYRNDNNIEMTNVPPVKTGDPNTFINQLPSTANSQEKKPQNASIGKSDFNTANVQRKQGKDYGIREFYFNNEELQKDIKKIIKGIPNVITPSNVLKGLVNFLPVSVALGSMGLSYAIIGTFEGVGAIANCVFKPATGLIGGGVGLFLDVVKIFSSWGKDIDLRYTKRGADAGAAVAEMFVVCGITVLGTPLKFIFDLTLMASVRLIPFKSKETGDALRRLAIGTTTRLADRYLLLGYKLPLELNIKAAISDPKLSTTEKINILALGIRDSAIKYREEILDTIHYLNVLKTEDFKSLENKVYQNFIDDGRLEKEYENHNPQEIKQIISFLQKKLEGIEGNNKKSTIIGVLQPEKENDGITEV